MSKIVICGSLKTFDRLKLLAHYLKQAISTAEVVLPMKDLEMFQAQKEYVGHIFNADVVLIVPKSIKYDINIINSSGYFLHNDHGAVSETRLKVANHNFMKHRGIEIGESTSYEAAIAEYFHKPYFIVTDETFIQEIKDGEYKFGGVVQK